ncbi:hypothetical protein LQ567_21985 [Niabella pedocola]|uniref:GLPGLI family protein n=1 Tax=Niabella pedocola TaxID=1752077 RepID=A0ABS8PX54_9BACT|nr:hypothetical protein [Niabella pedocola]MCD2425470.1 hypothetical protein [Niabella pedocola]
MRKEWILLLLLFITAAVNAQYPVLEQTSYKRGLYRNFEEFKNNNPSLPLTYQIFSEDTKPSLFDKRVQRLYELEIRKKEGRKIGPVFGFCDGTYIYIWSRSYKKDAFPLFSDAPLGPNARFAKLLILDTISYFEDIGVSAPVGVPVVGPYGITSGGANPSLYVRGNILDIRTGKLTELTKRILIERIKDDVELLAVFEKESGKQRKLGEYLMYYTARKRGSRELPQ